MSNHQTENNHNSLELKAIKQDLLHLFVINIAFLAILLGLFYWNVKTHSLETLLSKYLHI
jgi:hypothetical protein